MWPVPNLPGMPKLESGSKLSIAPALGQDTEEIMESLGYNADDIKNLINEKVILSY